MSAPCSSMTWQRAAVVVLDDLPTLERGAVLGVLGGGIGVARAPAGEALEEGHQRADLPRGEIEVAHLQLDAVAAVDARRVELEGGEGLRRLEVVVGDRVAEVERGEVLLGEAAELGRDRRRLLVAGDGVAAEAAVVADELLAALDAGEERPARVGAGHALVALGGVGDQRHVALVDLGRIQRLARERGDVLAHARRLDAVEAEVRHLGPVPVAAGVLDPVGDPVRRGLAGHVGERRRDVALAALPRLGDVHVAGGVAALAAEGLEVDLALLRGGAGHVRVALDLGLEGLRLTGGAGAARRVVAPLDEVRGDCHRLVAHGRVPLLVLGRGRGDRALGRRIRGAWARGWACASWRASRAGSGSSRGSTPASPWRSRCRGRGPSCGPRGSRRGCGSRCS